MQSRLLFGPQTVPSSIPRLEAMHGRTSSFKIRRPGPTHWSEAPSGTAFNNASLLKPSNASDSCTQYHAIQHSSWTPLVPPKLRSRLGTRMLLCFPLLYATVLISRAYATGRARFRFAADYCPSHDRNPPGLSICVLYK